MNCGKKLFRDGGNAPGRRAYSLPEGEKCKEKILVNFMKK